MTGINLQDNVMSGTVVNQSVGLLYGHVAVAGSETFP